MALPYRIYQEIPDIKVGAIKYPVYSVDYTAGIEAEPSEIKISFVSEDGEYIEPSLSLVNPVNITIGADDYNYFPIESNVRKSPQGGNILDVTFIDGSFILDKIWVGLLNKHGLESAYPILIVGEEVDPCGEEQIVNNPCNPCSDDSLIDCIKQRNERVLDVRYNFSDLLDEVSDFISIRNRPSIFSLNAKYYGRYTGTLRSVLKSWTSDYGMTFFWTKENEIQFIDLRSGFQVNTKNIENEPEVTSITKKKSLRGTSCNGVIAHYAQDRQTLDFNCSENNYVNLLLRPLNLTDITTEDRVRSHGSINNLEACSMLSYHSPVLRDIFVYTHIYKMTNYQSLNSKVGGKYPLMGDMVIKKVLAKESSGVDALLFHSYFEKLMESSNIDNLPEAAASALHNKKFSIVIYDADNDLKERFVEVEKNIGESFLGKYYIRKYGRSGKHMNWLAPSGSNVQYYSAEEEYYNEMPFINLISDYTTVNNTLGNKNSTLFKRSKDGDGNNIILTDDSFLLLERNAPWVPQPGSESTQKLIQDAALISPKDIDVYPLGNLKDIKTENTKAMIFFDLEGVFFATSTGAKNPADINKTKLKFTDGGSSVSWGLRDSRCRTLSVKLGTHASSKIIDLNGPSQGFSDTSATDHGGYMVIGNSNGTSLKKTIPKYENAILKYGSETETSINCENTMSINITVKEIKEELSTVLDNFCILDTAVIDSLMNQYLEKLSFAINEPTVVKEYEIQGLPKEEFSIADGLQGFQMNLDDNQGWTTNLRFETVKQQLQAQELIVKNFESYVEQYTRGNNSFNGLNSQSDIVDSSSVGSE